MAVGLGVAARLGSEERFLLPPGSAAYTGVRHIAHTAERNSDFANSHPR